MKGQNDCNVVLRFNTPHNAFNPLTPGSDTRPGVGMGCLEPGVTIGVTGNNTMEGVIYHLFQVDCTGDENPIFLAELSLTLFAQSSGILAFNGPTIGNGDEASRCYFIQQTLDGNSHDKCYKITANYQASCQDGTVESFFFIDSTICNFQPEIPVIHSDRQVICAGESIDFRVSGIHFPDDFYWTFEGGLPDTSDVRNNTVCYKTPGIYSVRLITENCLTRDTALEINYIEVLPNVVLNYPQEQNFETTEGDSLLLVSCAEGDSYQWHPSPSSGCSDCPEIWIFPEEDIIYHLTVGSTAKCTTTCQYNIVVNKAPEADFIARSTSVCENDCVQFINQSQFRPEEYFWEFEGGIPAWYEGPNPPEICYETPGTYDVLLTVWNEFGESHKFKTDLIEVYSMPNPNSSISLSQSLSLNTDSLLQLSACAEGLIYQWQPEEGLSCTDCPNPILTNTSIDQYILTISNGANNCAMVCDYNITYQFSEANIYAPNVFSPNDDGINDTFQLFGKNANWQLLSIFDRWGNLVFETSLSPFSWDGKRNNKLALSGVYLFVVEYVDLKTREKKLKSGDVLLFR